MPDMPDLMDDISAQLLKLQQQKLLRRRHIMDGAPGPILTIDRRQCLAFSSNDYLGLANHPALISAARDGLARFGVGAGSSALIGGHSSVCEELEIALAAFVHMPRALHFSTGYMANLGTLGKAAGVAGAFVAGDATLIEWLMQRARTYVFTTASPPLLASALLATLTLLQTENWRQQHLLRLARRLREGLADLPWPLPPSESAIQALIVADNQVAMDLIADLLEHNIWVPAIRTPTVPKGTARLRISLSAAHTTDQVDQLIAALNSLAKKYMQGK